MIHAPRATDASHALTSPPPDPPKRYEPRSRRGLTLLCTLSALVAWPGTAAVLRAAPEAPIPPEAAPPAPARDPAEARPDPAAPPPDRSAEAPAPAPKREAPRPAAKVLLPAPARQAPLPTPARPAAPTSTTSKAMGGLLRKAWSQVELGTLWYLQARHGHGTSADGRTDVDYNQFMVGRGYLNVGFKPVKWLEARITPDVHQDAEGDFKLRLKYLYAKLKLPRETAVVSEPFVEFGVVHMPWLDFEEHVNTYRMQGTMFAERQSLFNSADVGLTAGVLLGRRLPEAVARKMFEKYPGTWGSLAVGLYNGSGYHAIEKNLAKVVEGRFTLRPLGAFHPGLQLSYFFLWGQGNATREDSEPFGLPDWEHHQIMVSYAHPLFVASGQYLRGKGRQKGEGSTWVSSLDGESSPYQGASGFMELRLPWIWSSVIARYDWFEGPNPSEANAYHRLIAGFAFHFLGRNENVLLLDFDWAILEDMNDLWAVTLTLQIKIH